MSETDVLKMKVADLKRELKLRNLPIGGNKTELQERLQTALLEGDITLEDTASEELLDEDVLTDEEEKAALASPTDEKSLLHEKLEEEEEEELTSSETPNQKKKKIVLKRRNSLRSAGSALNNSIDSAIAKENSNTPEKRQKIDEEKLSDSSENNKAAKFGGINIAKISQLSMSERLEMRARKFGLNLKEDAPSTSKPVEAPNTEMQQKHIETLKKRAKRFGCSLSPEILDMEIREKMQKRQKRFGATATDLNSKGAKDVYAEKAKLRLERFKHK